MRDGIREGSREQIQLTSMEFNWPSRDRYFVEATRVRLPRVSDEE